MFRVELNEFLCTPDDHGDTGPRSDGEVQAEAHSTRSGLRNMLFNLEQTGLRGGTRPSRVQMDNVPLRQAVDPAPVGAEMPTTNSMVGVHLNGGSSDVLRQHPNGA